jgi:tRNA C32,U32 (ribose-2'-O)-methylase TrmJ
VKRRLPRLDERDVFAAYAYDLAVAAGLQKHRAERLGQLARRMTLRSQLDGKEIGLLVSLLRRATRAISEQKEQKEQKQKQTAADQVRSKT